jgi:hypothetical protein
MLPDRITGPGKDAGWEAARDGWHDHVNAGPSHSPGSAGMAGPGQPPWRSSRAFSRCQSRFFWVSRLSTVFLPLAMAIFSLAMPRWLK